MQWGSSLRIYVVVPTFNGIIPVGEYQMHTRDQIRLTELAGCAG